MLLIIALTRSFTTFVILRLDVVMHMSKQLKEYIP